MVQLCAAVTPARLPGTKVTQWSGGRPSLMAADRKRWLTVSMPSSDVTAATKNSDSPILPSALRTDSLPDHRRLGESWHGRQAPAQAFTLTQEYQSAVEGHCTGAR